MIPKIDILENTTIIFLPKIKSSVNWLYIFLLIGIIGALMSLSFIHTEISVRTSGITRPASERTEVKPLISGIIDTIYFKEGDTVHKGSVILRIKDLITKNRITLNNFEIAQREQFIHDLILLNEFVSNISIKMTVGEDSIDTKLQSPLYKAHLNRFVHQKREQELLLNKAFKEVEMHTSLARDKVISSKEFFDIQFNFDRILSLYKTFLKDQQTNWQQDLSRYRLELSQHQQQKEQVNADATYYEVKAPTYGILQGIYSRYAGGLLQANETLCTISPEGTLIAECYVQSKDIGLLKLGQATRFQIEAYNYNYFGILSGKIITIDNDFTMVNNMPVIKVRCSFDSTQLHLKNGFTGHLSKGLNFQASFIVAKRSLSQLLFDKIDDWLNPTSPLKF